MGEGGIIFCFQMQLIGSKDTRSIKNLTEIPKDGLGK
jgi:hypothetical protein